METNATVVYAGDGHDHYHVRRMMSYHLWSTRGTLRDRKIGFCFFDTNPRYLSLPRAPRTRGLPRVGLWRPEAPQHPERHLGGLGRPLPVELRLPVDRHHRACRRGRTRCARPSTCSATSASRPRRTTARTPGSRSTAGRSAWWAAAMPASTTTRHAVRPGRGLGHRRGAEGRLRPAPVLHLQRDAAGRAGGLHRPTPCVAADRQRLLRRRRGSRYEPYANRVGVAGIMGGCGTRGF